MNILTAVRTVSFLTKLFAAAKLNLTEIVEAGDESALAAHIEAQRTEAAKPSGTVDHSAAESALVTGAGITIAAGQTPAQALAAYVTGAKAAAVRAAALFSAATAAGIKITDATAPEQFGKEIENRISTKAGEELAKRGLGSAFVSDQPSINPAGAPKEAKTAGLTGLARTEAAYAAKSKV